jgi:hypothetical protein
MEHFVDIGVSGRYYKSIYSGPFGITLYAYPSRGIHCHLEIKGEAIEAIGQLRVFEFLQSLNSLKAPLMEGQTEQKLAKWSARRTDIALDGMPFTPRDCYEAFKRGDIRCAASRKSHKWYSNAEGDTFNLGSRSSGRLVRIYNRRGPTRLEMEFKGRWADMAGSVLAAQGCGDFETFSIGHVRQFVDFVDAHTGGSITRADLLPWWEQAVGDVARATLKPENNGFVGSAVYRASAYLDRLLCTLCVLRNGLGIRLDEVCDGAEYRLTAKHLLKIAEIKRALGS